MASSYPMSPRSILSTLLFASTAAAALDPIVIKGTKFFYENGTQFYIKGIAYQQNTAASNGAGPGGVTSVNFADPLANAAACRRDVPLLKELGSNAIRTYAIDPTADHSECMALLQDAGIYVISDLGEPKLSIESSVPRWNTELFARYKAVVDELGKYSNVIGFFAGNEVTHNASTTEASAFVKAAVRDTKSYISQKGTRPMYVGYASNDDSDIRNDIAHYFNCGDDQSQAIDFWGYNIYQWCGKNTIEGSGYAKQIDFFHNYSVPVFFAEYGCNVPDGAEGRLFEETVALYSDQMTEVFSGGIVYMYFQEMNDYGLVQLSGSNVTKMKNFDVLASQVAKVNPTSVAMSSYSPTNEPQPCPAIASNWKASNLLPPTPDDQLCQCMVSSLSCVPTAGLDTKAYGDIFSFVCASAGNPCAGINNNVTTGVHGAFSMCNDEQKLAYVLDRYYLNQKKDATACDFKGQATIKTPTTLSGDCEPKLAQASSANRVAATATSGPKTEDDKDSSAFATRPERVLTVGGFAIGAYLTIALGLGAGMILL